MTQHDSVSLRELWAARMRRFQQQPNTVQQFCHQEGVSPSNFYYWKRKVASAGQAPPPKFLPLTAPAQMDLKPTDFPHPETARRGCIELPRDLSREQWTDILTAYWAATSNHQRLENQA